MGRTVDVPHLTALAGTFRLQPGRSDSIIGSRPVVQPALLTRLLRGHAGAQAVRILGGLLSLCAHAHQRVAALAFNAACPLAEPLPVAPLMRHRLETVRDHLRCMALDWPQRLGLSPVAARPLQMLARSPVLRHTGEAAAGTPALALQQLQRDLLDPAQGGHGPWYPDPLAALQEWAERAADLKFSWVPLAVLNPQGAVQTAALQTLAQDMARDDFVLAPRWGGQCAQTGAWTRLRHGAGASTGSAWTLLCARWREVHEIAAAPPLDDCAVHDPLLSSGALTLGERSAIAWCEMARGLLLHWVRVDAQDRVADYRVLAPTEWNFHPQGALAGALAGLAPTDSAGARCLAAAFDACVECEIAGHGAEVGDA